MKWVMLRNALHTVLRAPLPTLCSSGGKHIVFWKLAMCLEHLSFPMRSTNALLITAGGQLHFQSSKTCPLRGEGLDELQR